ncbi:MAG TPA: serine/threonine-protein kinase [Polyangiaceae bacterium]|nr:serine/threonine-protein kinase [Polyangiaceae bacterium]
MNASGSIPVREGELLAGKYRVERVLGVGGMGVVVAARHEELGQLVAIKFVREDALGNEEAIERFLRESRAAARLRSEHVARVIDVGRLENGAPFMVMEFLEGFDLAEVLTRDGALTVEVAAALMLQVCEAVGEAHAAGIIHRDLKPENLFLTSTVGGTPKMKVLDFGVSKSQGLTQGEGGLTRTRAILGSPLYMAPEQMRSSRDVDVRIDVWALGVVLFELLTLRSPFEADTMPELCLKVVNEPPLSIRELRPDLPQGVTAIVDRCLEKDREKRFASAMELAAALRPFAPLGTNALSVRSPLDPHGPSIRTSWDGTNPAARAARESRSQAVTLARVSEPSILASSPSGASSFGLPVLTPSIPAAWGTEGRRESQEPSTPRRRRAVLVAVPLLVVVAVATFMVVRRSTPAPVVAAAPPPSASALSAAPEPPPPPLTPLAPAPVPAIEARVEPAASVTAPSRPPPSRPIVPAAKPGSFVAPVARPRVPEPGEGSRQPTRPAAAPRASAADDDIPALR